MARALVIDIQMKTTPPNSPKALASPPHTSSALSPDSRQKRGRPSREDMATRTATRDGLLQAARDLMIKKDGVEFSLVEIAKLTNQSPALIKYHFGNKEGLLLALIELDAIKAVDEMAALTARDLPVATKMALHIGGMINAYFDAPYANRLLNAVMQNATAQSAQRVSDIFLRPIANFQRDLLQRGQNEGVFREVDPMNFYFLILGSCDHFFSRRSALEHVFGIAHVTYPIKQHYTQTLVDVVMAGILVPSKTL
jgi:TetR/AcrR family transcriptional regulator